MSLGCCVLCPVRVSGPLRNASSHPQIPKVPKSEDPTETVTSVTGVGGSGLYHAINLSPLVDVLFAHYVGVDEEVSVAHTEMFLTGGTFETFQVVHFVFHPHGHLIGTDPLVTGGAETVLAKKPGGKKEREAKIVAEVTLEERA